MWILGLSTILVKETKIQVLKSMHSENYNNISILRTLHFNKQWSSLDGFDVSFLVPSPMSHLGPMGPNFRVSCFPQYILFSDNM